jgi:hypothetical protein
LHAVTSNVEDLLRVFAVRLPAKDVAVLRDMASAGEHGEFAAQLLAALAEERVPVSEEERAALAQIVAETGEGAEDLPNLNVAAGS